MVLGCVAGDDCFAKLELNNSSNEGKYEEVDEAGLCVSPGAGLIMQRLLLLALVGVLGGSKCLFLSLDISPDFPFGVSSSSITLREVSR